MHQIIDRRAPLSIEARPTQITLSPPPKKLILTQPMNPLSRRQFSKLSLAALAAAGLNPLRAAEAAGKPNSKVAGVQLGLNVPYSFHKDNMSGDEILANCIKLNLSG